MTMQPRDAARRLVPVARRHRHDTEDGRRLAPPLAEALAASRLCRLLLPGSPESAGVQPTEFLDVLAILSATEASLSWMVWNNALPCLLARYLQEPARADIFADPGWLYASSTRPSGRAVMEKEGYRVSGRWALVSGCDHAEWIAFLCIVEDEGETSMLTPEVPEMRMAFLRRGAYEIEDTWRTGGLRGTGSHHVTVTDQLVPAAFTFSLADPPGNAHPLERLPVFCNMSAGFAAQLLGIGRMALDTLVDSARTKITESRLPDLRDRPAAQSFAAARATALQAARSHLYASTEQVWKDAVAGRTADPAHVAALFAAAHYAIAIARETVDGVFALVGTAALYVDNPLERAHRDMHAMLRPIIAQPQWLEQAGRLEFGLEITEPMFFV
jgi:alkylation response protein AidB-like acyl-CoA dehydrogenase